MSMNWRRVLCLFGRHDWLRWNHNRQTRIKLRRCRRCLQVETAPMPPLTAVARKRALSEAIKEM